MAKQIPIAIPAVKDAEELRRHVVKHLTDVSRRIAQSDNRTAPMDLGQNPIHSVADPGNPTDAVNLRTLKKHITEVSTPPTRQPNAGGSSLYSIVFSSTGTLVAGMRSAPYIIMPQRTGSPAIVKVAATGTGTADAHFQVTRNGTNLLASDLVLPSGATGPVSTSIFIASPGLALNDLILPVVSTAGGVSYCTIEIEVQP